MKIAEILLRTEIKQFVLCRTALMVSNLFHLAGNEELLQTVTVAEQSCNSRSKRWYESVGGKCDRIDLHALQIMPLKYHWGTV